MSMSKITITESGLIDRYRIRYRIADLVPVDPGWRLVQINAEIKTLDLCEVAGWASVERTLMRFDGRRFYVDPEQSPWVLLDGHHLVVNCEGTAVLTLEAQFPLAAGEAYLLSPDEELPEGMEVVRPAPLHVDEDGTARARGPRTSGPPE